MTVLPGSNVDQYNANIVKLFLVGFYSCIYQIMSNLRWACKSQYNLFSDFDKIEFTVKFYIVTT